MKFVKYLPSFDVVLATRQEELRTFLFLTIVTAPVLAVAIVGGELFTGDAGAMPAADRLVVDVAVAMTRMKREVRMTTLLAVGKTGVLRPNARIDDADDDVFAFGVLLVPKAICATVEPEEIQFLHGSPGEAAGGHYQIARLERAGRDANRDKLPAVIHLELPPLCFTGTTLDVDEQKRMWINEFELRDNALDSHLATAIVNTRNRMMRAGRRTANGNCRSDPKHPSFH